MRRIRVIADCQLYSKTMTVLTDRVMKASSHTIKSEGWEATFTELDQLAKRLRVKPNGSARMVSAPDVHKTQKELAPLVEQARGVNQACSNPQDSRVLLFSTLGVGSFLMIPTFRETDFSL